MLSKKLTEAINDQIKAEFESSYIYLAMSAYFEDNNMKGMSHWMKKQAKEELEHAEKFMEYLYDRGAAVELQELSKPANKFEGPLAVFKEALKHEKYITGRVNKIMDIAKEEKDYATQSLLTWFIDEQVEEEAAADSIVKKIEFVGGSNTSLYLLDKELAQR